MIFTEQMRLTTVVFAALLAAFTLFQVEFDVIHCRWLQRKGFHDIKRHNGRENVALFLLHETFLCRLLCGAVAIY